MDYKLVLFHLDLTRTTLRPGSIPTKNFPEKSIPSTQSEHRESAQEIQRKRIECPVVIKVKSLPPYSSFDDFNKKISLLKLNQYKIERFTSFTKISKFEADYAIPSVEIYVKPDLQFKIRVFSWKLNESHQIYNYKLNEITLSTLINTIEQLSLCSGISLPSTNVNVIAHVVPKCYDPCMSETFPLHQDIYYRSRNCLVLSESLMCKCCVKSKPKVIKAENRKAIISATPAKDKAPLSLTSPARIRSKILSLNSIKNDLLIENKELKTQVTRLQGELNEASVKVSDELDNDLKSIFSSINDSDLPPFMKLFWSEQQKYLGKSS